MPRKPLLSGYPNLKRVLQENRQANSEFNVLTSATRGDQRDTAEIERLETALADARTRLQNAMHDLHHAEDACKRFEACVISCGEVMESQVSLAPYSQDVATKRKYNIRFTATQVRTALRLYWEVLALGVERNVVRVAKIEDPAADRAGEEEP